MAVRATALGAEVAEDGAAVRATFVGFEVVTEELSTLRASTLGSEVAEDGGVGVRVSMVGLESAEPIETRALVSFAELYVDASSARALVTWAELQIGLPPARVLVSWAELQLPSGTRVDVIQAFLQVPYPPGPGRNGGETGPGDELTGLGRYNGIVGE